MNFTRKTSPTPTPPQWYAAGWAEVQNRFPSGRVFSFLTQTLAVACYTTTPDSTPALIAKYLLADGRVAQEVFTVAEIPLLLAIDAAQQTAPAHPQPPR